MNKRVVITGMGVIAPNATGVKNLQQTLYHGHSGIRFIDELKNLKFACQVGGIPNISTSPHIKFLDQYELSQADISIKYSVLAAIEASIQAKIEIPEINSIKINNDIGVIVGSCYSGTEIFTRKMFPYVNSGNTKRLGSQIIEHWMPSGSAAAISKIFATGNQLSANSSACSTGTEAIIMAYERIKSGNAKIMFAGGTDPYSPYAWAGFDSMRLLSRNYNNNPEKASRPMSSSANGFVPSAGAGVLIIEELESALERNVKILAEIKSAYSNSGGQRNGGSMTATNQEQAKRCIETSLTLAEINATEIDLISGHLTGTIADEKEINIWHKALNLKDQNPFINAPKSIFGHLIGAAGAVETIASIIQLQNNFIHPSINCEDLKPEIEAIWGTDKIPQKTITDKDINLIAKAGFGFGDVNTCIILKKW